MYNFGIYNPSKTKYSSSDNLQKNTTSEPRLYRQGKLNTINLLYKACEVGNIDIVRRYLDSTNINDITTNGTTPLHIATKAGHLNIVKMLIDKGADVNKQDNFGQTALYVAAKQGYKILVKILLDKGADVNEQDTQRQTSLHIATKQGDESLVKILLDREANVNQQDDFGQTSLHIAAKQGDESLVKIFLDKEANANQQDNFGQTPLHVAAKQGDESLVKILLDKEANVNQQDSSGQTALHLAAENEHREIICIIIANENTNVTIRNSNGQNISHTLTRKVYLPALVLEILLTKANFNINEKDDNDQTALYFASARGYTDIVKLLIDKGADIYASTINYKETTRSILQKINKNSKTKGSYKKTVNLILQAKSDTNDVGTNNNDINKNEIDTNKATTNIKKGYKEVVEKLLATHADINRTDIYFGNTLLYIASKNGHVQTVELLLLHNNGTYDYNALFVACESGHVAIVKTLLERKPNISYKNNRGQTALHIAIRHSQAEIVQILLEHEYDIYEKSSHGQDSLDIAYKQSSARVTKLVQDKYDEPKRNKEHNLTALHVVSRKSKLEQVQKAISIMSDLQIDIDAADIFGNTALHKAVENKNSGVIRALLNNEGKKPNVNKKNQVSGITSVITRLVTGSLQEDKTPLHLASINGNVTAVEELLEAKDIKVNEQDSDGHTALHLACINNNIAVVKRLLAVKDIDIFVEANNKYTAMHSACFNGYVDIAGLFVDKLNKSLRNKVKDIFNNILKSKLNNIAALFACGKINLVEHNYDTAIDYFGKILKLKPDNWHLIERVAETYRASPNDKINENYEACINMFEKTLAISDTYLGNRGCGEAYYSYAERLRLSKSSDKAIMIAPLYKEALKYYEKAFTYKPENDSLEKIINNLKAQLTLSPELTIIANEEVRLGKRIGDNSGFGQLREGTWQNEKVAIKIYKNEQQHNIGDLALVEFIHEANIMKGLDHENIIKMYGVCNLSWENIPNYSLILEYAEQGSLSNILYNKKTDLLWHGCHKLALQIAKGLKYLHTRGIIHRDLNSRNILIKDNTAKICDFGISSIFRESNSMIISDEHAGQPDWMAPELFAQQKYTKASDIYSFGIILWQLVIRQEIFGIAYYY